MTKDCQKKHLGNVKGAYVVMETHKPSGRLDLETNEKIAAPLIS